MEIEFKFILPEEISFSDIIEKESASIIPNTNESFKMKAFYFDTVDFSLRKKHLTFRARFENDDVVCTVKYGGGSTEGLHKREEINISVKKDFIDNPTLEVLRGYDIYDEYVNTVNGKCLIPVVYMEYDREQVNININESTFAISYDDGKILANDKECKIGELEVELYDGKEKDLIDFCDSLCKKYKLIPCDDSKYKRGINLYKENCGKI